MTAQPPPREDAAAERAARQAAREARRAEVAARREARRASWRAEIEAARAEMRQRMQSLPSDADARRQQAQAARQRLVSRLNATLNPDQRARLAAMRGGGARSEGTPGTIWVLDGEGAPRSVAVRTGITDGTMTEILAGPLEPGATVVIGQDRAGAAAPAATAASRLF